LWSSSSREALRGFKARNELDPDDSWDATTEQKLMAATTLFGAEDVEAGFGAATNGVWSVDPRACPGGTGGSDSLVITITSMRAETDGARCEFSAVSGSGMNWKSVGVCTVNGATRTSNITFVRAGNTLVWSSQNGVTKYLRCPS
jgi:hypothetical protein